MHRGFVKIAAFVVLRGNIMSLEFSLCDTLQKSSRYKKNPKQNIFKPSICMFLFDASLAKLKCFEKLSQKCIKL